jgi:hypothetical protein
LNKAVFCPHLKLYLLDSPEMWKMAWVCLAYREYLKGNMQQEEHFVVHKLLLREAS